MRKANEIFLPHDDYDGYGALFCFTIPSFLQEGLLVERWKIETQVIFQWENLMIPISDYFHRWPLHWYTLTRYIPWGILWCHSFTEYWCLELKKFFKDNIFRTSRACTSVWLILLAKIKAGVPSKAYIPLIFFIMTLFLEINCFLGCVRDCKNSLPLGGRFRIEFH
jgi:hypothetical protein